MKTEGITDIQAEMVKHYVNSMFHGCDPTTCAVCFAHRYRESCGWYCAIEHITGKKPTKENGGFNNTAAAYFAACVDSRIAAYLEKNNPTIFARCPNCNSLLRDDDIALIPVEREDGEIEENEGCPDCEHIYPFYEMPVDHYRLNLFCNSGKVHKGINFPEIFIGKTVEKCELEAIKSGWSNPEENKWICPECTKDEERRKA